MNPWFGKGAVLLGAILMVAIRAPHGQRSRAVKVADNRKGRCEIVLLTVAWASFFLPLVWVFTGWPHFANYPLHAVPWFVGTLSLAGGLWWFHRTHADLGTNWSITLEIRENHVLVTGGAYRNVRHPMYASLIVFAIGQALVLPNWIAGPSYLVAMALLFAFRVGPEERLMLERFGSEYEAYRARTKRLFPHVW